MYETEAAHVGSKEVVMYVQGWETLVLFKYRILFSNGLYICQKRHIKSIRRYEIGNQG